MNSWFRLIDADYHILCVCVCRCVSYITRSLHKIITTIYIQPVEFNIHNMVIFIIIDLFYSSGIFLSIIFIVILNFTLGWIRIFLFWIMIIVSTRKKNPKSIWLICLSFNQSSLYCDIEFINKLYWITQKRAEEINIWKKIISFSIIG